MKKSYFLLISFLFSACGTLDYQTIYLNDAKVVGPLNNPPIFITDERNAIQISPRLSLNSINALKGSVSSGNYQVDTISYNGIVNWKLPQFTAGLDIDVPVSPNVSFFGSLSYSSQDNYYLTGGTFGIGLKSVTKGSAIRFNLGGTIQQYRYDAHSVVVSTITPFIGNQYTRTDFYHDVNTKSNFDFFVNLTYNTIIPDLPVNFYCSLAWFKQTVLNYSPRNLDLHNSTLIVNDYNNNDMSIESTSNFLSITPGVYMNLNQNVRLVVGVNVVWNNGELNSLPDQSSSNLYVMPLAKLDFLF